MSAIQKSFLDFIFGDDPTDAPAPPDPNIPAGNDPATTPAGTKKPRRIRRDRFGRVLPPLTREQRRRRKLARERYAKMQAFLFGPRVKRKKKTRAIFALFPDVDDFPLATFFVNHLDDAAVQNAVDMEVSTIPQETIELGQLIIKERAAMVRETWSENKKRKRNCFFVKPLDWRNSSIDDSATGQDGHLSGE